MNSVRLKLCTIFTEPCIYSIDSVAQPGFYQTLMGVQEKYYFTTFIVIYENVFFGKIRYQTKSLLEFWYKMKILYVIRYINCSLKWFNYVVQKLLFL